MAEVSKPCVWSETPADAVTFKTAVRQNNGGVRVEIDLDKGQLTGSQAGETGLQKMRIQTPKFRRFRIKKWEDARAGQPGKPKVSYSGSFSIGDLQGIGMPAKFVNDWVRPVEERIIETAASKSIEWFKKSKGLPELKVAFNSSINEGGVNQDGVQYGPLMKCKIPLIRGQFECDFFKGDSADPDTMKGTPSSLREYEEATENGAQGVDCVAILEYQNVWFMGASFGVTPILKSLLYWPQDKLTGFAFQADPALGTTSAVGEKREADGPGPADAFLEDGPVPKRPKPS